MLEFKVFLDNKLISRTVLSKGQITVGRTPDNDLVLQNKHVSRHHLTIERDGEGYRLEDKSSNGILLDGQKVPRSASLPDRCTLEIYPFHIDCLRHSEDGTMPIPKKEIPSPESEAVQEPETPPIPSLYHYDLLIGESPRMQQVYRLIEDVSNSPATVLVRGEHGTGKELVARAIHQASRRSRAPFIAVNCAAIPFDLIESELFGFEKGAFTGASASQKGKIEEAKDGTLFLDEIGELSLPAQAKLLRFLQGKTFTRLGSARETFVDIRIVTATNKDLERAVREERFRIDLYYRIKVVQITLPPLRERREDIPLLVSHFLRKMVHDLALTFDPVPTPAAMKLLQEANWPGNIRQLENVLYSALIRSRPPHLIDEALLLGDSPTWAGAPPAEEDGPIDAINKQLLLRILKENHWDTAKASEVLKVSRGTIYYKMKKYGIDLKQSSRGSS